MLSVNAPEELTLRFWYLRLHGGSTFSHCSFKAMAAVYVPNGIKTVYTCYSHPLAKGWPLLLEEEKRYRSILIRKPSVSFL